MRAEREKLFGYFKVHFSNNWNKVDKLSLYWAICLPFLCFYFYHKILIPAEYAREQLFLLLSAISLVSFPFSRLIKIYFLPCLLILISFLNCQNILHTAYIMQLIPFVAGIALLIQLSSYSLSKKVIFKSFLLIFIVECLWVISNRLGFEITQYAFPQVVFQTGINIASKSVPIMGSLYNPVPTGLLISAMIPFLFRSSMIYPLIPIGFYCIYLTDSAAAFLSSFFSMITLFTLSLCKDTEIMWAVRKKIISRIIVVLGLISPLFVYLFNQGFFYPSERFIKWPLVIKFVNNPIWGDGLGYFRDFFSNYYMGAEKWGNAHNIILDIYTTFGFIGIIIFLYFLSRVRITDRYVFSSFLGLMVGGMFYSSLHCVPLVIIMIILYSFLTRRD